MFWNYNSNTGNEHMFENVRAILKLTVGFIIYRGKSDEQALKKGQERGLERSTAASS